MCKSEIFAKILRIVSKETEVSEDLILSKCKRSDIVDSRGIMVVILSEYKFSESKYRHLPDLRSNRSTS